MSNIYNTQDEISRDDIIHKIDTNLFVEAGAGSGKTTMLVNRMVAMIEAGVPVEKICAITFTKNAALEFYERFQAKLIDRANINNTQKTNRAGELDEPNDTTRSRCLKALENIDLCFMGTIDSFCNMILLEHPTEANIPSDAKLIDNNQTSEIYKQFYIDARSGFYGEEIKLYSDRFSILYWHPEEAFACLMSEIMDRRNVNFIVDDSLCIDFFKCFSKARQDVKKALDAFNKDLTKLSLKLSNNDKREPLDVFSQANDTLQKGWHYNYTGVVKALKDIAGLTYDISPDKLDLDGVSVIRQADDKTILNIKDEENKDALIYKLNNYKYQNSLKLCKLSIKPLEQLMRKQGKFTFFDYLYYLREMLIRDKDNGGKLIEYIYNRHSYFLIDEFQDTNPMQAEVFFYLTAQDSKQKTWKACKPKAGSLFIVGDPKQSIYRFRSADVSSYLKIKEIFKDKNVGEVKYLVNNFRSKNDVKRYFNDVFNEVMPEDSEEQSKYLDIENTNKDEPQEFNGIYSYETYSESLLKDYPNMSDNKRIIAIVKALVNNQKYQIIGKDGKLRPITFGDFMIIFSSKKPISSCIKAFEEENIPTRVEGKVLFEECEGLKIINDLYQTISDKTNIISLIKTLFSPVFGLNDNDLALYRSKAKQIRLQEINEPNDDVEIAIAKLNDTANSISSLTPSSLYEKIMDDYEIFKYIDSKGLEIVYYVLELIRNEEHNGNIITYKDAVNYMNDLLSGKSDLERCLSLKQNVDAVHIANLHKVKGLEAPIVILAKAGSASTSPTIRIEHKEDENRNTKVNGYIISISDKNSDYDFALPVIETNANKEKADEEKQSLKKENDRLVYVAATRARNVLIVSDPKMARAGKINSMANKWKSLKQYVKQDFFEVIQENIDYKTPERETINADDLYANVQLTKITRNQTYSFVQPSDIQSSSTLVENQYESITASTDNIDTYSTLIGTMVHRMMEIIVISNDSIASNKIVNNILNEYLTAEFKQYENTIKQKLIDVYNIIHNGGYPQKGNISQDILSIIKSADRIYSEIPFTYKNENNELCNGIIDLIYEKDNKLHIVDWKTNKSDDNLDEHYNSQLQAYKDAVKQILNKEVEDALIYHISLQ